MRTIPHGRAALLRRLDQGEAAASSYQKHARLLMTFSITFLLVALLGSGCVSKKRAQAQARQAYIQGQEKAMLAAQRARQQQAPVVFVQGPVRNPEVPWQEGMKLSQAVVAAEYTGFMNPRLVRVLRNGQVAGELKGIDLLHHQDLELEDGDTVLVIP